MRALVVLFLILPLPGQVRISEFLAANHLNIVDFEGDRPDWIEIENYGTAAVDLGGWFLTDSAGKPEKWAFPRPTVLAAGQFLVVFASGKDRVQPNGELHTSFRLSSKGEYLALRTSGGVVASEYSPSFPMQFPGISYGRSGTRSAYFLAASPGKSNGAVKPIVGRCEFSPARPTMATPITVTAELIRDAGVAVSQVELFYRRNYGPERTVSMRDDGQGGDLRAGDDLWTGVIPAGIPAGRQVRWRVRATHAIGVARAPLFRSKTESPQWFGTRIDDPSVASSIPILYWWVTNPANARSGFGTRASVFYRGKFYDNVHVRRRGASSGGWPKANFKFDFNPGYHFEFRPGEDELEEFNVNSTWSDKAFVRQVLSYETYDNAGVAGCHAEPIRMQQNGAFHSVGIFIEQTDERLLEREGLDPRGALYKMYNTLTSAYGSVEKKTRKWENHSDLAALVNGVKLTGTALERYLFDNVDIPAVINYVAATVLIHDQDHVHKNHYLYRDTEGDREWRFLPWDKDLTFGRNYSLSLGVLNDLMSADVDPAGHPLLGSRWQGNPGGNWNRLIDACHSTPRIREMFLRRLRTLVDSLLQSPGTPRSSRRLERRMDRLAATMGPDVARDRARWGVPAYGDRSIDFAKGRNRIETLYLEPRRRHLLVTHGPAGSGLLPAKEPADAGLSFGALVARPNGQNPEQSFVEIVNCNAFAVDVSGWTVAGGIKFEFEPGTVIAASDSLYLSASPAGFRKRTTGPRGGQGHLVVGPFAGRLDKADPIRVFDGTRLVASVGGFSYAMTTQGQGGVLVEVHGAAPYSELFTLISVQTNHRIGCGPALGLGTDALAVIGLPLGAEPFHVVADGAGRYRYQVGPGTLPRGVTLDSLVIAIDHATSTLRISPVRRVTF